MCPSVKSHTSTSTRWTYVEIRPLFGYVEIGKAISRKRLQDTTSTSCKRKGTHAHPKWPFRGMFWMNFIKINCWRRATSSWKDLDLGFHTLHFCWHTDTYTDIGMHISKYIGGIIYTMVVMFLDMIYYILAVSVLPFSIALYFNIVFFMLTMRLMVRILPLRIMLINHPWTLIVMLHRTLHLQLIYCIFMYFSVFLQNFQQEFLYPRIHVSVLCIFICIYLFTSVYSTYHMYLSFQWPIFFSEFQMFENMDDHSAQLDILFPPRTGAFRLGCCIQDLQVSRCCSAAREWTIVGSLGWGCQEHIQGATRKRCRSSWKLKWCWCVFCWLLLIGSRSSSLKFFEYLLLVEGKNACVLYSKYALRRCFFLTMLAFAGDQDAKDVGVQILGFLSTSQKEEGHGVAKKAESDVLLQVAWK